MGESRQCLVSFRDGEGVERVAEVTAESLFEAGALALKQFRRGDWSREASLDAGTLRVEVRESVRGLRSWWYLRLCLATSDLGNDAGDFLPLLPAPIAHIQKSDAANNYHHNENRAETLRECGCQ